MKELSSKSGDSLNRCQCSLNIFFIIDFFQFNLHTRYTMYWIIIRLKTVYRNLLKENMRTILTGFICGVVILLTFSCGNSGKKSENTVGDDGHKVKQLDDGTINLQIDKAFCYNNISDPSYNAAEWNIIVTKPGRYEVWLSSATIDTLDLQYKNLVTISFQEKQLNVKPVSNKIVLNSRGVRYPYYRADSYMGEFYIQDPGEYSVQLISEKVIAKSDTISGVLDHTRVLSVFMRPMKN